MPPRQRKLFPEPDGGLMEELRPIVRPHSLREIASYQRGEPIMVRLDVIRAAYANSGLTHDQIGKVIGKSRYTVAKALRVEPGTEFYTFCEVMNVIGVEMAELFPIRKKRKLPDRKPDVKWSRGPYLKENTKRRQRELELKEVNKRSRGRTR